MSSEELISLFNQSNKKIKKMETEIESINIELSNTLKKSSNNLPPSPKYINIISELQNKIHELKIEIDDKRRYRNQKALELSKLKKEKEN